MSNTILTIGGITRKALSLFLNSNAFLQSISREYDSSFGVEGAKIGSTLKIRLPNDPILRSGATASPQAIAERSTTITVATQLGTDLSFTSAEMALSMDDFASRILEPAMNNLAGGIAADVMSLAETVPNITHAVDGSNNTISPTMQTWINAGAILDGLSCPRGNRTAILDPLTAARTVGTMTSIFNPNSKISEQFRTGSMNGGGAALGVDDWRMDQTVIKHTTAAYSTLGTVAAGGVTTGSNNGSNVATSALAGPLAVGDIVTFSLVNSVNRVTKATTGTLAQFVVTAAASGSATSISVYPAIIGPTTPSAGDYQGAVAYQTVSVLPLTGATIASPVNASEVYRKNLVIGSKEAFTLVTADLMLPKKAVLDASRENYSGVSMRCIQDWVTVSDYQLTRFDVLYGYCATRPEWAVIVADAV